MKRLLILGAGQYGVVAKEIAQAMNCFSEILFLDDSSEAAVGKLEDIENMEYDLAFVAIGNVHVRERWLGRIDRAVTLIHPKAEISPSATIGEGSIVEAGAVISAGANVGKGAIVMANAAVGHNATVGEYCQLEYNCSIPENRIVPDKTVVECNSIWRNQ